MAAIMWKIQGEEKKKFDNIFDSLGPIAGKLSGDKVKPVLMNSKLPTDVLGQVWELSDIDKDGFLDREEFCVAMHLVYKALDREPVPAVLPPDIVPPSKRKTGLAGAVQVLPPPISTVPSVTTVASTSLSPIISVTSRTPQAGVSKGLVPDIEYARFSGIFSQKAGADNFIAGAAARDVFMQSGLPQAVLAHVWNLCDQQQLGKLTQDQFIMAMHYISQKVKGIEVPTQLPPEMLSSKSKDLLIGDSGNISDSSSGVGDFSAVRELDTLNREIEELRREKETLTAEIREKEQIVRFRSNEVQELQNTLDRASTSLSQLESDKAESHTRLDELDQQQLKLDGMLADIRNKVQEETRTIASLQSQIKAQEMAIAAQEEEYSRVKNELESLKKEETQLQQTLEIGQQQLQNITKQVTEAEQEIQKVQEQIKGLTEQEKTVSSNIAQYDKAVTALKCETEASNGTSADADLSSNLFQNKDDPFKMSDPFAADNVFKSDPFADTSHFNAANTKVLPTADSMSSSNAFGMGSNDPFSDKSDPFASASKPFESSAFDSDPFAGSDHFTSSPSPATSTEKNSTAKPAEMFSANFFDQDNSVSLFNDMEQSMTSQATKEASDDPWANFGSSAETDTDINGADLFGKDSFVPNSTPTFNALSQNFSSQSNNNNKLSSKDVKNMSEEAQLAWAAERSRKAEEERKEKLRIQEQMDLEYAIKLSREM